MTDDKREWARPVEEVARALAADIEETGPKFTRQSWDELSDLAKLTMFQRARAAINTLRRLGMIHEGGLKAIREEERK